MKKTASIALIAVFGLGLIGCYGPFNLTKSLNRGIRKIDNKWAAEGVFLVCAILPVYSITILGDALIFNSIEFWGGTNPIKAKNISIEDGNKQVVATFKGNDRVRIDVFEAYRPVDTINITPGPDGNLVAKSDSGDVYSAIYNADKSVSLTKNGEPFNVR
jgi:Domain of unknown function (DUF3332)